MSQGGFVNLPIIPSNDKNRLESLYSYKILHTPMELEFDMITKLAAKICQSPFAFLNFIDNDKQWTKSSFGFGVDLPPLPRASAICSHTILGKELFVITDLSQDPRFSDNHFVVYEPHLRFYAGMPLITKDSFALGALCVVDTLTKELTFEQRQALIALTKKTMDLLEKRKEKFKLKNLESSRHSRF